MATGTVKELEEERKREEGRRLRRELLSAMAKCARGALWVSETDAQGRPRVVAGAAVLFAGIESAAETPGEESPFERLLLRELAAAGCAPHATAS